MAVIEISDLRVARGGKLVLHDLSLTVAAGEIYALLGGNGAGKSTTLSTLLGFLKPSAGKVVVAGTDPANDPEATRHKIAYLPENVALYEHLTARENVDYFLALANAKTLPDVVAAQTELMRRQIATMNEQTHEFAKLAEDVSARSISPLNQTFARSFGAAA